MAIYEMATLRRVGDSLMVTLSPRICAATDLTIGDKLLVTVTEGGEIRLIPEGKVVLAQ